MILIALGANLPSRYGKPEETLEAAKHALEAAGIMIRRSSRTWVSAPVPASDQPWYRNAVISVETHLGPKALLQCLLEIEQSFGRVRSKKASEKNASRVLDLDLIAYFDTISDTPQVQIPHPRMQERAFVLLPLQEIAPRWTHPVLDKTVDDLVANLPDPNSAQPIDQQVKDVI